MTRLVNTAIPLLAALALSANLVASPPVSAQGDGRLAVGVGAAPHTMDPQGSDADSNMSAMTNIFDGLVQRNTAGELKPALATSWQRVDALTWRFHLRKGVKFHNGNDFTWEDVQFAMQRLAVPKISEFTSFGALIASVAPVGSDPWVIDIKTKNRVPFFVQTLHMVFIMDKESTEARSPGEVAQTPIGTGAYRFVEWIKGSHLRLAANEQYWGGAPSIKQVEFRGITEPSTRLAAIASGQIGILQDVPVSLRKTLEGNPQLDLVSRPARRSIFLGLANKPGTPTADLRVRKAIYMAINEQEIIDKVMFGRATPAAQIPDPPTVGYGKEIRRLPYDLEGARKLLAEAGYPSGFELTLTGPNDRYVQDEQIQTTVAVQLAKVGIKVNVDSKPKSVFFPQLGEHELQFYLLGWFDGSYDFGRTFRTLLHTVDVERGLGSLNGAGYSNPRLDKIFAASEDIVDLEKRAATLRQLNETAMEQVAIIPLHYQMDDYAVRKDRGIRFTPRSDTWIVFKEISRSGS